MEKTDITIIGAGVIGLAVASEISRPNRSIFILEKNHTHGGGISSRNSEVIHAGLYYPAGSLKASLCVAGNRLIYDIAAKHKIPHARTGKLIVATAHDEREELERLHLNSRGNDVPSVSMLSRKQITVMEPNIQSLAALYSPDTGIISVHDLMNYFLTDALSRKARMVYNTQVIKIEKDAGRWRILTRSPKGEDFEFSSACVINAAGLESDTIAGMAGRNYQLHYCKGDYCSISGVRKGTVQRLIYPVPETNHTGLGVHLTMDLNGRLKLGPDAAYIDRKENYHVAAEKAEIFFHSAGKFLPFLKKENVHPDMAGIRPRLQGPDDGFCDFVIKEDAPGFINLVGIESPGMTASPAIARYVREKYVG